MKKTNSPRLPKRLVVRRETLAQLASEQLHLVAGGLPTDGCFTTVSKQTNVCHSN